MIPFGSQEYLAEMTRRTNSDLEYLEMAKNDNESYTMIIEAQPEKGVPRTIVVGYQEQNGRIVEAWLGERPTTFTLSGPYGVWVDILRGKLGPTRAFTMRKLKVRGNFLKLLASGDTTVRWLQILQTIPTAFEGEFAEFNIQDQP